MVQMTRTDSTHNVVLFLVTTVINDYVKNEWPSPTIKQLSSKIGYSEEAILESMEFGTIERVPLLQ
ncbi:hypothetical protein HXA34_09220 [Salipaludibacillus agaradhaerens]|uniref:Uncharacterized protein n=1 Tax=Salipaludibacillus agaradhaerens TaxID=76935 RepID=A0A9Q4B1W3_SALAG|nr:hypothetical protein [Salipaludibacillus agaradhaerens]UJW57591.1 hypothetical protein HXZ66_09345 [Bacillus sp. A116_S68]MCR6096635.1 hypothetical protein [Salipaludibacillus agaradhaerens]MCR6106459.1 hypothetical protein [Salipaludibacillus agaradhaerens]MCR6113806.1 hypothetical protein [Salipaludibacillus agaradhaerens]MCR6118492.1 hypothetical protein [Salipaludibacillus agaradhaerens]